MTTRLLGRWALLLSRCSQASASAARLKAHDALAVEPLWSQAWIQTPVRPLCVGRENAQEWKPKSNIEIQHLYNAATTQEVLQIWKDQGGSANLAGLCLIRLNKLAGQNKLIAADILKDPQCVDLLKAVYSQETKLFHKTLVHLLRALCGLGVPPHSEVIQSVQNEALWRIRRLKTRELCSLVDWAYGYPAYKDGNEIVTTAALKQLELRWTELNEPQIVSTVMRRIARHSQSPLMEKLEDKALELAEKFTAEDIRVMLLFLASQKRRTVPLLRGLSYYLEQKFSSELTTPLLMDVAYTYGKLNFRHTPMLWRIAAELFGRLHEMTSAEVSQCSKALAFLNWFHLPLFEGFAKHFLSKSTDYSTVDLYNLLLSFAKLNFQPCNMEEFYKRVHEVLESSWRGLEPFLLIDLVWSLCVLQQAKPEHITAVTDPAFQTKLAGASAERSRLKLLHIAASGQLESLRESSVWPTVHLPAPQDKEHSPMSLQSSVFTALQSLTESCPTALRTNVNTLYGWTVDAELVVNSDNQPIDLEKLVAPHLPGGGGSEPLPEGAHRMAFLMWEFKHFLSSGKELLGRFAMQKRHLQLAGFLVVEVPYFEWQEMKSDWKKVAYLKDKIGKAVAEERAK